MLLSARGRPVKARPPAGGDGAEPGLRYGAWRWQALGDEVDAEDQEEHRHHRRVVRGQPGLGRVERAGPRPAEHRVGHGQAMERLAMTTKTTVATMASDVLSPELGQPRGRARVRSRFFGFTAARRPPARRP